MDHRRYLPQERLLGLPGEPTLRRVCRTRTGCTQLRDRKWCAHTDDRVRERERHGIEQLGTLSERRIAQQDPAPCFTLLCCDEHCPLLPLITVHLVYLSSLMWIRGVDHRQIMLLWMDGRMFSCIF